MMKVFFNKMISKLIDIYNHRNNKILMIVEFIQLQLFNH